MSADAGDTERHSYVITANTTLKNMDDQLSYFMEDPRLNTFNMYYRAFYPSWYNVTEYGHTIDRRGEQFYYTYQQIYARYMLERLSNGMPEPKPFTYNTPFQVLIVTSGSLPAVKIPTLAFLGGDAWWICM